jgi:hypothetical protein
MLDRHLEAHLLEIRQLPQEFPMFVFYSRIINIIVPIKCDASGLIKQGRDT